MRKLTMNFREGFIMILLLNFILLPSSISQLSFDIITPNQSLKDGDVLVSSRKIFALGFFSPGNSVNRYVGVWFNKVPEQTVVWVANRDNPVPDKSGLLRINGNGGLVIYGKDRSIPLWSANVTLSSPNNSMAKLLDTGNLVLLEDEGSQRATWEGFNHPSNTILAYMKLGLNRRSGLNRILTSWKSAEDPGTGNCSFKIDPSGLPQLILYKGGVPWWRAGPWTGKRWSGRPNIATTAGLYTVIFDNNEEELSYMYTVANDSSFTKGVVDESGRYQRFLWSDQQDQWIQIGSDPDEWCDSYGQCGPNSNCGPHNSDDLSFACTCLPGFEPKFPQDWRLKVGKGGCIRKAGVSTCQSGEGFVKVSRVKLPDTSAARVNMSLSLKECREKCLMDCSCTSYSSAYENEGGIGCVTWHGHLMDTRTYSKIGQDLYVRVDATSLAKYVKKSDGSISKKGKLAISVASILVSFLVIVVAYWSVIKRKRISEERSRRSLFSNGRRMNSDLPSFDLSTISAATDNFSNSNRLGKGGFGPVYKGVLDGGKEIAVKRLCKNSGQGHEEFKNEVEVIAKLQHRNLVKILGYCIQDEEKMLIYEYLPNKSLDTFIFEETKRAVLDWTKRLEIICGIARGILYLHQDSRLRIIHRDLKSSNVLLDSAMNPKIADFGMARIFDANQIQANTNRVVGTYGYMSPEYAMEGLFSVKSDVYSFGILLLEIVSGRKNTDYYHDNLHSNLVGHVWDLWKESRALEIVDATLGESLPDIEVLRCIQIALLCVQEYASDRPNMAAVVFMLSNNAALQSPRKPGFLLKCSNYTSGDPSTEGAHSINDVTCTIVEPR